MNGVVLNRLRVLSFQRNNTTLFGLDRCVLLSGYTSILDRLSIFRLEAFKTVRRLTMRKLLICYQQCFPRKCNSDDVSLIINNNSLLYVQIYDQGLQ